jgi:hypothetical protein
MPHFVWINSINILIYPHFEGVTMTNPLQGLYRAIKTYVQLPSKGAFYDDTILKLVDTTNEVGIYGMTGNDELLFKNPDALLNGQAMINVLKSCVDGLVDPKKLLVNDVDALIIGIRIATYGDEMDLSVTCPSCSHEGTYGLDLPSILSNMSSIDAEYTADLANGTQVFIKPHLYQDTLKASLVTFEQTKTLRAMDNGALSDDEKMKLFSNAFNAMLSTNVEMVANSIVKVINDEHGIEVVNDVKNKDNIISFIKNIEKTDIDIINNKIREVNSLGIDKNIHITCKECGHEWSSQVEFDPVTFFSGS